MKEKKKDKTAGSNPMTKISNQTNISHKKKKLNEEVLTKRLVSNT